MTHETYPIQQQATGETLLVHAYTFGGEVPGPTVYLQANLHGPEIFGTTILGKIIEKLETHHPIPGKVIIVPCANPIGVQEQVYNGHSGRWHAQSGTNWNRIFCTEAAWSDRTDAVAHYQSLLDQTDCSITDTLAATLRLLSNDASHVLDIHTTGSQSVPHLFTHQEGRQTFASLDAAAHIIWGKEDAMRAFDESHVVPFAPSPATHAATWEVGAHGPVFSEDLLRARVESLWRWLLSIWQQTAVEVTPAAVSVPVGDSKHLCSSAAGYITWVAKPGDTVLEGDTYATIYQPWHNQHVTLTADRSFLLLGSYGVGAIAKGEQLAWVVFVK